MPDTDLCGLDKARNALAAGRAVVLPTPSPLTYGVTATNPQAVNLAKGRPPEQEVAFWVHDDAVWHALAPAFDLRLAALTTAFGLLRRELVTLLIPLRADTPPPVWITPAVREGHALFFGGRWVPLAGLLAGFPRLYVSSANRTGHSPVATAAAATAMFGPGIPVVDGDALRDFNRPHGATTMLRIARGGELTLVRHGIQDTGYGRDPAAYLERLRIMGVA